jgi:hypothetical protein
MTPNRTTRIAAHAVNATRLTEGTGIVDEIE